MYTLESKLYYKVKLPLFNIYKNPAGAISSAQSKMYSFASEHRRTDSSVFDDAKALFDKSDISRKWFGNFTNELRHIHALITKLQTSEDSSFYGDALIFNYGVTAAISSQTLHHAHYAHEISMLAGNLSSDSFYEGAKVFGDDCFEYFSTYLPLSLTIWHDVLKSNMSDIQKAQYTDYACTLFEYILHRAALSFRCSRNNDHNAALMNQVMCCYKWLKGKKIYLPKNLQEMVYEYPLILVP